MHIYIYIFYIYMYIYIYININNLFPQCVKSAQYKCRTFICNIWTNKLNRHFSNWKFNVYILTTHFINSCKLQAYVPKYILTVFTFAFNHTFHLNLLSLQTITAPYSASTSDIQLPGHRLKTIENVVGLFLEQFFRKSNYINVTIFLHAITHTCVFQNHTDCK